LEDAGREELETAIARTKQKTDAHLALADAWYFRQPALAIAPSDLVARARRAGGWASKLGLELASGDCRKGVCRLELLPKKGVRRHVRMRPLPKAQKLGDQAMLFRLPGSDGLRTILFTATDGALPATVTEP
jgi:hypothetical protein